MVLGKIWKGRVLFFLLQNFALTLENVKITKLLVVIAVTFEHMSDALQNCLSSFPLTFDEMWHFVITCSTFNQRYLLLTRTKQDPVMSLRLSFVLYPTPSNPSKVWKKRHRCMKHRGLSGQPCGTDEEAADEDCHCHWLLLYKQA